MSCKEVSAKMETLQCATVDSPVGPLFLAASQKGLVMLLFENRVRDPRSNSSTNSGKSPSGRNSRAHDKATLPAQCRDVAWEESPRAMRSYTRELEQYFAGKRREFSFPLDLRGTDFQLACWRALLAIPYGETRTYADIARVAGKPNAFRAAGLANNRNPIAIVVPCHRVIASDGTLCGYGGGLNIKRKLLELEGALTGTLAA
jgi:methylated-DNA-[protein]-cysteine S-methyltransferase